MSSIEFDMDNLRECKCGGHGIVHRIRDFEYIQCDECKCRTEDHNIRYRTDMAISWNYRLRLIREPVDLYRATTYDVYNELLHRQGVDYMIVPYGDTVALERYHRGETAETISGFGYAVALVVWSSVSDVDPYGRK